MTVSARSNTETPANIVAEIQHLADVGLGWEDVVFEMHKEGRHVGKALVRQIVLKLPPENHGARSIDPGEVSQAGARGMNTRNT